MAATKTPTTDEVFEQQLFPFGVEHVNEDTMVRESYLKMKGANKRQWADDLLETADIGQIVHTLVSYKVESVDFIDIGENKVRRVHSMKPLNTTVVPERVYLDALNASDQTEGAG